MKAEQVPYVSKYLAGPDEDLGGWVCVCRDAIGTWWLGCCEDSAEGAKFDLIDGVVRAGYSASDLDFRTLLMFRVPGAP